MSNNGYHFTSSATTGEEAGYGWRRYLPKRRGRSHGVSAASMLIKVGLCVGACAAVLLISKFTAPEGQGVSADTYGDEDDRLGSLRFVDVPGLITVFSSSGLQLPIAHTAAEALDDGTVLALTGTAGEYAAAPAAGTVLAAGMSDIMGGYVIMRHADDTSTTCYGLASVSVEEGQIVDRYDTIGAVGDSGRLFLSVSVAGRPQDVAAVFGTSG